MNNLHNGNLVETMTGKMVDLLEPDPATICIEDIAWGLSYQVRFNGHCRRPYTVGDHSIACADEAMRQGLPVLYVLGALMHDAAEAYLGDIVSPVKGLFRDAVKPVEDHLGDVIWQTLCPGLYDTCHTTDVKAIDTLMLATEAECLMPSRGRYYKNLPAPSKTISIEVCDPIFVAEAFVLAHSKLLAKCRWTMGLE